MKIFLAGPFFNEPCRDELHGLIRTMENEGHHLFCAMRDGALVPKDAPKEIRQKFFNLDFEKVEWCEVMVAMLDYPLIPTHKLKLVCKYATGVEIHLPDMGTVFEIGCAYALNKPVIGFTKQGHSLNLMLSECCVTAVANWADLDTALDLVVKWEWNRNTIVVHTMSGKPLYYEERVKEAIKDMQALCEMNVTKRKELFQL